MKVWFLLALAIAGSALASGKKQDLTIQKAWEFKRIGSPSLSPDGRLAVVPIANPNMGESRLETDLWLFATDGSRSQQLTSNASDESSPLFSPDGKWIAFTAKRDKDKAAQIYVLPVNGGEALRVTNVPTGASEIRWFPDSNRLAFVSRVWPELTTWEEQGKRLTEREESKMTGRVWTSTPVTSFDTFVDDRQAHIYSIKLENGQPEAITLKANIELTRPLPMGEGSRYDLSSDGKSVAFVSDSNPASAVLNSDIFILKIGENKALNITMGNPASDDTPRFSPDGKKLAYLRSSIPNFYGDTDRLVVANVDGTEAKTYFTDWDRSIGNFIWAQDSKRVFSSIDDAGTSRIYELPLNGRPRPVTQTPSYTGLALSQTSEPIMVATRQSFVEVPTLVRVDPRSGRATEISLVNKELASSINWGTYESVSYKGADGDDVQMWINYPAGFDKNRKYPVFLMLHGGPHNGITDAMQWRWNAQVFAAMGYVTVWHNFHGSSGFGQKFVESISKDWMTRPYEDTIKAADWLAAQTWADKNRMVAGGGSYGGYLASVLLGRPHPFQSLIVHAGVYNLYSQYAADFAYTQSHYGEFWENPALYQATSPHLQAANFKTPTLVIHGQLDLRVPVNHGFELYHTLQKKGVPSRLLYFPNENHWILKPQNSVFWYQQVASWLQEYAPVNGPTVAQSKGQEAP